MYTPPPDPENSQSTPQPAYRHRLGGSGAIETAVSAAVVVLGVAWLAVNPLVALALVATAALLSSIVLVPLAVVKAVLVVDRLARGRPRLAPVTRARSVVDWALALGRSTEA